MASSDPDELDSDAKQELDHLDGVLPETVNRRAFFKGAVAMTVAGLAGCTGDGGSGSTPTDGNGSTPTDGNGSTPTDGNSGTSSTSFQNIEATWRGDWTAVPNYSVQYMSDHEGFWEDQNVPSPEIKAGQGTGDTIQRIGTGTEELGLVALPGGAPQGLAEGMDIKIWGASKARSIWTMIYRPDLVEGPNDFGGESFVEQSPTAQPMLKTFLDWEAPDVAYEDIETVGSGETAGPALLDQGDVGGVMGTINDVPTFRKNVSTDIEIVPVASIKPIYGYALGANGTWLEEGNHLDYVTRLLEGYSQAGRWVLLNPEAALDVMVNDVNTALQTQERSTLLDSMRGGIAATNSLDEIKNNGFGYISTDRIQTTLDEIGGVLDIADGLPSAEEFVDTRPQEDAELATFTDSEWSQIMDWADPLPSYFD